jgi:hypothetical protein
LGTWKYYVFIAHLIFWPASNISLELNIKNEMLAAIVLSFIPLSMSALLFYLHLFIGFLFL